MGERGGGGQTFDEVAGVLGERAAGVVTDYLDDLLHGVDNLCLEALDFCGERCALALVDWWEERRAGGGCGGDAIGAGGGGAAAGPVVVELLDDAAQRRDELIEVHVEEAQPLQAVLEVLERLLVERYAEPGCAEHDALLPCLRLGRLVLLHERAV